MKIQHKTKDESKIARALDPEPSMMAFIKAFIADHEANPTKLTPALRAFVESYLTEREKARVRKEKRIKP